jgi:hypothetical protein
VTGNPANGKAEPFDLEAAAAAATAEAGGRNVPFGFTYKGRAYELPPMTTWPLQALRSIGTGDLDSALAMLLGEEVYGDLAGAGLRLGDLNVLFEAAAKAAGAGSLPNSRPPRRRASTRM